MYATRTKRQPAQHPQDTGVGLYVKLRCIERRCIETLLAFFLPLCLWLVDCIDRFGVCRITTTGTAAKVLGVLVEVSPHGVDLVNQCIDRIIGDLLRGVTVVST